MSKTIGSAIQKGQNISVYDDRNRPMFVLHGILEGYTRDIVSVRKHNQITTYDAKGTPKFSRPL